MKHHLWNFLGIVGACFTGLLFLVGGNALINRLLGPRRPLVEDAQIHEHLRVGAFFASGDTYGDDPDGLPGCLEFPTLYLTVHIHADKTVRKRQDGHPWEPVTGRLRDDILYAYSQKVWG